MATLFEGSVKGALYGQAVGDALGLAAEYKSKRDVERLYPYKIRSYGDMAARRSQDSHLAKFEPGEWTDDTEQMLIILELLLACEGRCPQDDLALRLRKWLQKEGRGSGSTFRGVVEPEQYLDAPVITARQFWLDSGKTRAPNGALMRTAACGFFKGEDLPRRCAEVTHYDPRCVRSCEALTAIIRSHTISDGPEHDPAWYVDTGWEGLNAQDLTLLTAERVEDLNLGPQSRDGYGYTVRTLGAALWAYRHARSFAHGLYTIIDEGGDADTNAAVAGALMGAKWGYDSIPYHLIEGLQNREVLEMYTQEIVKFWSRRGHDIDPGVGPC